MKYIVSISYTTSGKNESCIRERAQQLVGRKAVIRVKEQYETIKTARDLFQKWKKLGDAKKELFMVFALNTHNEVIKSEVISMGTINLSVVHPREVFKFAIDNLAAGIIVAHNHPAGSLEPSQEDIDVTFRLKQAGLLLGIEVIDHIIITRSGYQSLKEIGLV